MESVESTNDNTKYQENKDEAIMAQEKQIEKEIAVCNPLVGPKIETSSLNNEYAADDVVYHQKILDLTKKYKYLRKTRPDGNCFYRSFGYVYLERLLTDREELERFKNYLLGSKEELIKLGFPEFTIEDFHETFTQVINKVDSGLSETELLKTFNDQGISDYIVIYFRLITSGYLQKNREFFSNFIEIDLEDFCHQEVEPMYKESDHVHIIALTSTLNVTVCIQYMDRGQGGEVNAHTFPEGGNPSIHLLYRPGHYDILYQH